MNQLKWHNPPLLRTKNKNIKDNVNCCDLRRRNLFLINKAANLIFINYGHYFKNLAVLLYIFWKLLLHAIIQLLICYAQLTPIYIKQISQLNTNKMT